MKKIIKNEINRKLFHIFSSIIPISYLWIIKDKKFIILVLVILIIIAITIELLRNHNKLINSIFKRYFSSMLRKSESDGEVTGATWLLSSYLITIIIFPKPIAIAALIFLSIGDSIAAMVGNIFPFFSIGNKHITGSIAGIIISYLVVLSINQDLQQLVIFYGAIAAMTIELIPIRINDNITIPLFSGTVMEILDIIL